MSKHIVEQIMDKLIEVNRGVEFDRSWAEGYISGIADYELIDELEFEQIMEWLHEMTSKEDC
jgi:hypothetical protein